MSAQNPEISTAPVPKIGEYHNREVLATLENEYNAISTSTALSIVGAIVSPVILSPVALFALAGPLFTAPALLLKRLQKLAQVTRVMDAIVERFEARGVEVFPLIEVPDQEPADLFVRFPNKEYLLIAIRSMGKSTLIYRESDQQFYTRRRDGTKRFQKLRYDPLAQLGAQEAWLRKNRRDLYGGTSRDSRRFLGKVLVVWDETKVADHKEHLYAKIGSRRILQIRRRGTFYVIQEEQIFNFIKAYLSFRRQQASSTTMQSAPARVG